MSLPGRAGYLPHPITVHWDMTLMQKMSLIKFHYHNTCFAVYMKFWVSQSICAAGISFVRSTAPARICSMAVLFLLCLIGRHCYSSYLLHSGWWSWSFDGGWWLWKRVRFAWRWQLWGGNRLTGTCRHCLGQRWYLIEEKWLVVTHWLKDDEWLGDCRY